MCLIGIRIAQSSGGEPELTIAGNRDEFADRPSLPLHWWPEGVLAGKDQRAGGTWLGMTRSGRFAAVTNVRDPELMNQAGPKSSRGLLVNAFLLGESSPQAYANDLLDALTTPAGFNLIVGQIQPNGISCFWIGGRAQKIMPLAAGTHVLSNAELNTPWPKALRLQQALAEGGLDSAHEVLTSTALAPDEHLPATGVPYALEKKLSAALILGENYHTRATTLLSATTTRARVREISWSGSGDAIADISERFEISV